VDREDGEGSALSRLERDPCSTSENAFNRLKRSISESGCHQRIIAAKELRVLGGHQRIKALLEPGSKQAPVLVPDKKLSDDQFKRLSIQDNFPFEEWNFDILSSDLCIQELTVFRMPDQGLGARRKGRARDVEPG
jgi:ParB-like chromosome segregation protein Spo0J